MAQSSVGRVISLKSNISRTRRHLGRSSTQKNLAMGIKQGGGLKKVGMGRIKALLGGTARVSAKLGVRGGKGHWLRRDSHGRFA